MDKTITREMEVEKTKRRSNCGIQAIKGYGKEIRKGSLSIGQLYRNLLEE